MPTACWELGSALPAPLPGRRAGGEKLRAQGTERFWYTSGGSGDQNLASMFIEVGRLRQGTLDPSLSPAVVWEAQTDADPKATACLCPSNSPNLSPSLPTMAAIQTQTSTDHCSSPL